MWLNKQHYKVFTRFGGQIQAVHFSGILNSRRWTSQKTCWFLQKSWFPGDQSTMYSTIWPQYFCTYYFLCELLLGTPQRNTLGTSGNTKNKKSIFPPHPNKNTSPPDCMFSWLTDSMQIQFLKLVVISFGLYEYPLVGWLPICITVHASTN
jgi:hypothetical protein